MSTYRHDYKAFGALVLNAPWMEADMRARAERVKALAEAIAPYDPTDRDGEHYRDFFEADSGTHGGIHHDRTYGRVSNTHPAARYIEFGTAESVDDKGRKHGATPRHRTLGKALDAAG